MDIRVRAIDALLPIGDTAVVNADPRCKLLLTQMAFFPIISDSATDLIFHIVTAFSLLYGQEREIAIEKSRYS